MKRLCLYLVIVLIVNILLWIYSLSYASDDNICTDSQKQVCYQTPNQINDYRNFIDAIFKVINSGSKSKESLTQEQTKELEEKTELLNLMQEKEDWTLSEDKESRLQELMGKYNLQWDISAVSRAIDELINIWWDLASWVKYSFNPLIFYGKGIFTNFFANVKILYKPYQVIRDWKLLQWYDDKIQNIIMTMLLKWNYNKIISWKEKTEITAYLTEFMWKNFIYRMDWEYQISLYTDTTYLDLALFMWDFNCLYKEIFLAWIWVNDYVWLWDEELLALVDKFLWEYRKDKKIYTRFDYKKIRDYIWDDTNSLYNTYKCAAKLNWCPWWFKEFWEHVKKIYKIWFEWWLNDTIKSFSRNRNLLLEALHDVSSFWKAELSDTYLDKQQKLLRQYYGSDISRDILNYTWMWWIGKVLDGVKENITDPLYNNKALNRLKWLLNNKTDQSQASKDSSFDYNVIQDLSFASATDYSLFEKMMNEDFNDIMKLQESADLYTVLEEPLILTQNFPVLSKQVYSAVNKLWSRDKEHTLLRIFWDICTLQCNNLWWICRYY